MEEINIVREKTEASERLTDLDFGFAVPQIMGNKVKYVDTSNVRGTYTQARHYMGSLKYKFYILTAIYEFSPLW